MRYDDLLTFFVSFPGHSISESLVGLYIQRLIAFSSQLVDCFSLSVHRPYMLNKRGCSQYDHSRKAAIEAARADLIGRRDFQLNKPSHLGKLPIGAYWVLNSYSKRLV